MNKATKLLKQSKEEMETKKIPTLITKGKLALENYANDLSSKIIDKEEALELADLSFVRGDVSKITHILELKDDILDLKKDLVNVKAYMEEMYKD